MGHAPRDVHAYPQASGERRKGAGCSNSCGVIRPVQRQKPVSAEFLPHHFIAHELPVEEQRVFVLREAVERRAQSVAIHPEEDLRPNGAKQQTGDRRRQSRVKEQRGECEYQRHNLRQTLMAFQMAIKRFPEGSIRGPAVEEVGNLPQPAEPAPVVKNVLKSVQRMKHQSIFITQRVKRQFSAGTRHPAIQRPRRNIQGNMECLFIPEAHVQFHLPR